MDASDPVSCLLCLSAYERSTMLRVHLRAIASDSTSVYYFCQKCGGAIAAEYLYIQNSGKAELQNTSHDHDPPSGETWDDGLAHEHEPGIMKPPIAEPAAAAGEKKTIEASADAHEVSAKDTKRAGKSPK